MFLLFQLPTLNNMSLPTSETFIENENIVSTLYNVSYTRNAKWKPH